MKLVLKTPHRTGYWLAVSWLLFLLAIGLLAPWLPLPYPPATPDLLHMATPPSPPHYLGTDPLGRDVLAGLVTGARRLVLLSLPAVGLATLVGALAGSAAGFWGNRQLRLPLTSIGWLLATGWWLAALPARIFIVTVLLLTTVAASWYVSRQASSASHSTARTFPLPLDSLVLGTITLLGAVPRLILLVALATGPPLSSVQLLSLLALVAWPETARLVRAQMLRVRVQPFIEAAYASGLPAWRVWLHHALPHACLPLFSFAPLSLAGLIGLENALAFLGIGQAPDQVSWGSLLTTVRQDPTAWWVAAAPGIALLCTLLALQQLAQALNKRFNTQ